MKEILNLVSKMSQSKIKKWKCIVMVSCEQHLLYDSMYKLNAIFIIVL